MHSVRSDKPLNNCKVVVVDDEVDLCELLADELTLAGATVSVAHNGQDGLSLIEKVRPMVVLSDIQMPQLTGRDLLRKTIERGIQVPVFLMITGHTVYAVDELLNEGADGVIYKPFDLEKLVEQVAHYLRPLHEKFRHERVEADPGAHIVVNFDNLNEAQGQLFNVGRGGMFVALVRDLPEAGSQVSFSFRFADEHSRIREFSGRGIVRWVRTVDAPEAPAGFGLEFTYLKEPSLSHLLKLINALKTRAFFPKGLN